MGRNPIDLTQQQFGSLTAIKPTTIRKNGSVVWEVYCECGKTSFVTASNLRRGATKSCGCSPKEWLKEASRKGGRASGKKKAKDLTNLQFGRLKAIEPTEERKNSFIVWKCECLSDGNITFVSSHDLLSGDTQSCGCLARERSTTHGLSKTKEYQRMKDRKRRDKEKLYDVTWTMEMEVALKEFQSKCILCGSTEDLTIDHVFPLSKGNGLNPGNVVILCRHHNSIKATKDLYDLPIEMSIKLVVNAVLFEEYWNHKNNYIVNTHEN